MKKCPRCFQSKSLDQFYKCRGRVFSYCKTCSKLRSSEIAKRNPERRRATGLKSHLKTVYGLELTLYNEMLLSSGGFCPICNKLMNPPCVDHDHETKVVRGLLCRNCNSLLGCAIESPLILRNAIAYLEHHKNQNQNQNTK